MNASKIQRRKPQLSQIQNGIRQKLTFLVGREAVRHGAMVLGLRIEIKNGWRRAPDKCVSREDISRLTLVA